MKSGDKLNVTIKGHNWTILCDKDDEYLNNCDAYTIYTTRTIVINDWKPQSEYEAIDVYQRKVLRHEIIHAFMFESGLGENFSHPEHGHDETMVDWIAFQFEDIYEVFEKLGLIEGLRKGLNCENLT